MTLSRRAFLGKAATAAAGGFAIASGLTACIDTTGAASTQVTIDISSREFRDAIESRSPFRYERGAFVKKGFYVVPYPTGTREARRYVDAGVAASGLMVLGEQCPHEGCHVNFCSSRWFECPCCGGKFNMAGEYKLGPAIRGLDRLKMDVSGTTLIVLATTVVKGPPRGVNTTGQEKEGPFCV